MEFANYNTADLNIIGGYEIFITYTLLNINDTH
jgi:hypothetical protein